MSGFSPEAVTSSFPIRLFCRFWSVRIACKGHAMCFESSCLYAFKYAVSAYMHIEANLTGYNEIFCGTLLQTFKQHAKIFAKKFTIGKYCIIMKLGWMFHNVL